MSEPLPVTAYVLAGGKSSRMGRDKALLELNGRPLIELAVEKLRSVCASTFILSGRKELARYAPLVSDLHPGCGPLGGMEAALLHTQTDWNLFLAVDMPFVPAAFLSEWVRGVLSLPKVRISLFTVDMVPQPTLCLVHRGVTPFVQEAIQSHRYRVLTVLEEAARRLAAHSVDLLSDVLLERVLGAQGFFANINTLEEFALAEAQLAAHASNMEIPEA